ncbi:hypothetical protein Pelo_1689 [Pelomyxa schiedti]|nr:hypothetical protein Pelo_1689 [Pelomyxa schiedti]
MRSAQETTQRKKDRKKANRKRRRQAAATVTMLRNKETNTDVTPTPDYSEVCSIESVNDGLGFAAQDLQGNTSAEPYIPLEITVEPSSKKSRGVSGVWIAECGTTNQVQLTTATVYISCDLEFLHCISCEALQQLAPSLQTQAFADEASASTETNPDRMQHHGLRCAKCFCLLARDCDWEYVNGQLWVNWPPSIHWDGLILKHCKVYCCNMHEVGYQCHTTRANMSSFIPILKVHKTTFAENFLNNPAFSGSEKVVNKVRFSGFSNST